MSRPKIVTSFEYPPIPIRTFDWCAYREGMEEYGNYGWGRTEHAAIRDLLECEEDTETDFAADAIVKAFEPLSKLARQP